MTEGPDADFRAFSARLGANRLRVQAAGGNTSLKRGGVMWVKASGAELADARDKPIFTAVDLARARAEAAGDGPGDCRAAMLDPGAALRPSIETTFHAALPWRIVAHTHSIAAIAHAISPEGCEAALGKLPGAMLAPYVKPGLPLTREIERLRAPDTRVILLANHGLIVCGETIAETETLMEEVEAALALPAADLSAPSPGEDAPEGYDWVPWANGLALDERLARLARAGSYYPDHVVFLGAALPGAEGAARGAPALLIEGRGVALRTGATPSQRALLRCLADVFAHAPADWTPTAIGPEAEAELLDWDAEKHRQSLARKAEP